MLADAGAIYQHDTVATYWQALGDLRTKWAGAEPEAVATLERDFAQTLTYLRVRDRARARGLRYRLECLRTTSPLERVNRHFRRKARQVVIFHAPADVTAARELVIVHRHLTPSAADTWTEQLEMTLAAA